MTLDQSPIRQVLLELNPSVAHKANETPETSEIYTPRHHAYALDPNRALVVGGRGVGKSFWAAVLANGASRSVAANSYPALGLENIDVELGFHEGAAGTTGVAPSAAALKSALDRNVDPVAIWRSVLIKALTPGVGPQKTRRPRCTN